MTHNQQFHCPSDRVPRKSVHLPATFDNSVKRYVIRWESICRAFPGALYVLKDNEMVEFECDTQLTELEPKRIAAFLDSILEVVVESHGSEVTHPTQPSRTNTESIQLRDTEVHNEIDIVKSGEQDETKQVISISDQHTQAITELINHQTVTFTAAFEVLSTNQLNMQRLQLRALNHLAFVQAKLQAVLTQNYELFEYPIPRLFIILPKEIRLADRFNPFTVAFQLHFLCECGAHTMANAPKSLHKIHIAKHDGYDVEKPNEFLEKYGRYILTVLKMIKFAAVATAVVAPAIAMANISEQLELASTKIKGHKDKLASYVDDAIKFLQPKMKSTGPSDEFDDKSDYSHIEPLEGADLRQLLKFISKYDPDRTLGNLYRVVTSEGHVKWVCLDHYRENYKESTRKRLGEIVESNAGEYNENEGKIVIKLVSRSAAKHFYNALQKAKDIHELDIWLDWDASLDDLRKLQSTVKMCNISILRLNASRFQGPLRDVFNRGRRFDPFIEIMTNGRVQSFELAGCQGFFRRISILPKCANGTSLRKLAFRNFDPNEFGLVSGLLKVLPESGELHLTNDEVHVSVGKLEMAPDSSDENNRFSLSISTISSDQPFSLGSTRVLFNKDLAELTLSENACSMSNLEDILKHSPELDSITIKLKNYRNVFNIYYLITQCLRSLSHPLQFIKMEHDDCHDRVSIECYDGKIYKVTIEEMRIRLGRDHSFSDDAHVPIIINGGSLHLGDFPCSGDDSLDENMVHEFWEKYPGSSSMSVVCFDLDNPKNLELLIQMATRYGSTISGLYLSGGNTQIWVPELQNGNVNIEAFPKLSNFEFAFQVSEIKPEEDGIAILKEDGLGERAGKNLYEEEEEKEKGERDEGSTDAESESMSDREDRSDSEWEGPLVEWLKEMFPRYGAKAPRPVKLAVKLRDIPLCGAQWGSLISYTDFVTLNDLEIIGGSLGEVDLEILEDKADVTNLGHAIVVKPRIQSE
ncbi:hypothetical protein BGW38_009949 [Lunasporangiospora selenospora]|uniref:Uncharacterized protein n=1 Tax=Lunasporangiospora selenospora TaxID=979761 RepID=A0A9P6KF43_9FUNG|nr:hypothetical protein BGW38_009949 [Lunasporangiospora selenospora]